MSYTKGYSVNSSAINGVADTDASACWYGAPLKSTLMFLSWPFLLVFMVGVVQVEMPGWMLYGFAFILGVVLLFKSLEDPEWTLAAFALYIPLSKMIVVPIAPGINATNLFILLLIVSLLSIEKDRRGAAFSEYPGFKLVKWYAILSCFSALTLFFVDGGVSYFIEDVFTEYKGWVDQFIVFLLFLAMIRDQDMAKRMVVYMMIGLLVGLALGVVEMLDKSGLDTIEKSRVYGPQQQPNDFGAFLVYNIAPFIGISLLYMTRLRMLAIFPLLLLYTKVLLATFSRGAYLGLAFAAILATYVRGKTFLVFLGIFLLVVIQTFPELVPQSLTDRFSQTSGSGLHSQKLDSSSQHRIILWNAAVDMTLESPVLGKGFKAFPALKDEYTERHVPVSDTHNMYLFISSQMGIPALIFFLLLLYKFYSMSSYLANASSERFVRAIGIGGAAMVGGVVAINMFGSRMVNIEVCGYFWIYLAVIMRLVYEQQIQDKDVSSETGDN